jgi:hypothetical protein
MVITKTVVNRLIRKIDLLIACTTCLVCLFSTVCGCFKNVLGRGIAISGHITKPEQSIFSLDIYGCK